MTQNTGMLKMLWVSLITLALDLGSKFAVVANLETGEQMTISAFLNFKLVYNDAAAMGLFGFLSSWQFVGLAILVCGVMVVWLKRMPSNHKVEGLAVGMIIGGALGNAFDRAYYGEVVDFIDFVWPYSNPPWHWYTFNIADVGIVVGVGLMLFHSFFLEAKLKAAREQH